MSDEKLHEGLSGLKEGDVVFVVLQNLPWQRRTSRETRMATVTKVGRKYGYVLLRNRQCPFCLSTGRSHHAQDSVRNNGLGFDVFRTEADYRRAEKKSP